MQNLAVQPLLNSEMLIEAKENFNNLDVSGDTIKEYQSRIGLFVDFVGSEGLSSSSFLDFKRDLAERSDIGIATKNKYLATARVLLKELNRKGDLPQDITQNIKGFNQDRKHKKEGLNDEEMSILINKIEQLEGNQETTRLKAIFSLLALQGLRQCEIIRLDVRDLDFVAQTAMIQGKGRDDKEAISLQPATVRALQSYLRSNKIADGAIFVSRSNNNKNKRLTTRSLRELVKSMLTELGINKTTHGFRHWFTTRLIKDYKGDLLEVSRYTRHKNIETLQIYNDNIKKKADLPRFYKVFEGVRF